MSLSTFGERRNDDSYANVRIAQATINQLDASCVIKRAISPKIALREENVRII